MSLLVYISKTKQGNKKLKDNLLCYFKCSFKQDKLDFRVQFSFNEILLDMKTQKGRCTTNTDSIV